MFTRFPVSIPTTSQGLLRKAAAVTAAVVVLGAGLAISGSSPMAQAATPVAQSPVDCAPDIGFNQCKRFGFTGADQTFTVPAGVTSLNVQAWGAGGGTGIGAQGGGGGFAGGTINVDSADRFTVMVGGTTRPYSSSSTYGNGGAGATAGGGMSGLFVGSIKGTLPTPEQTVLVAGGGGAGGAGLFGGGGPGGGVTGGDAVLGRQRSVGGSAIRGGSACERGDGDGLAFRGGSSRNSAGGGAGWFGGGGCTLSAGGAGGSGYLSDRVSNGELVAGTGGSHALAGSQYAPGTADGGVVRFLASVGTGETVAVNEHAETTTYVVSSGTEIEVRGNTSMIFDRRRGHSFRVVGSEVGATRSPDLLELIGAGTVEVVSGVVVLREHVDHTAGSVTIQWADPVALLLSGPVETLFEDGEYRWVARLTNSGTEDFTSLNPARFTLLHRGLSFDPDAVEFSVDDEPVEIAGWGSLFDLYNFSVPIPAGKTLIATWLARVDFPVSSLGSVNVTLASMDTSSTCTGCFVSKPVSSPTVRAVADSFEVNSGSSVLGDVLANDVSSFGPGRLDADVELFDAPDWVAGPAPLTVQPPRGVTGQFTFDYTVGDVRLENLFSSALVTVNVSPVATNDSPAALAVGAHSIDVLGNDFANPANMTVSLVSGAPSWASISMDKKLLVDIPVGTTTVPAIRYTICHVGTTLCSTATAEITVLIPATTTTSTTTTTMPTTTSTTTTAVASTSTWTSTTRPIESTSSTSVVVASTAALVVASTIPATAPATLGPIASTLPVSTVTAQALTTAQASTTVVRRIPVLAVAVIGTQLRVTGAGWEPDTDVEIVMYSQPTVLGTTRSTATGVIDALFPIPTDKEPGDHRLEGRAVASETRVTAEVAFTLQASSAVVVPPVPISTIEPAQQGELALTGGTISMLMMAPFASIAAGLLLLVVVTGRREGTG